MQIYIVLYKEIREKLSKSDNIGLVTFSNEWYNTITEFYTKFDVYIYYKPYFEKLQVGGLSVDILHYDTKACISFFYCSLFYQ